MNINLTNQDIEAIEVDGPTIRFIFKESVAVSKNDILNLSFEYTIPESGRTWYVPQTSDEEPI